MNNNFTSGDMSAVRKLLKKKKIILTQSKTVEKFEKSWSKWLKVKYSTFVNSGSSANFISISLLKALNKNKKKKRNYITSANLGFRYKFCYNEWVQTCFC